MAELSLHSLNNKDITFVPGHQLDKVVVEGDARPSVKDGGVCIANEIGGDNLERRGERK